MKNITTFVDNVGRVIVGQKQKSSGEILQIKEPAVVPKVPIVDDKEACDNWLMIA